MKTCCACLKNCPGGCECECHHDTKIPQMDFGSLDQMILSRFRKWEAARLKYRAAKDALGVHRRLESQLTAQAEDAEREIEAAFTALSMLGLSPMDDLLGAPVDENTKWKNRAFVPTAFLTEKQP